MENLKIFKIEDFEKIFFSDEYYFWGLGPKILSKIDLKSRKSKIGRLKKYVF